MVPPSPVSSPVPTFRKIPGTYSEAEGDLESESWRRNGQLVHVSECRTSVGFSVTIVSRAIEPRQKIITGIEGQVCGSPSPVSFVAK